MKHALHHVLAAIAGLALASMMVFFVFGSADEQGAAQDGEAPTLGGATSDRDRSSCGTVAVGDAASSAAVEAALADPAPVLDAESREVAVDDQGQARWIAQLHAALSLCTDEIALRPNEGPDTVAVAVTFPDEMPDDQIAAHTYELVGAALGRGPFAINTVTADVRTATGTRELLVARTVWQTFTTQREGLGLPASLPGLLAMGERVSYNRNELDSSGW